MGTLSCVHVSKKPKQTKNHKNQQKNPTTKITHQTKNKSTNLVGLKQQHNPTRIALMPQ